MKTSNKLLIILAVVLLTVPLGIALVIAKTNRIDHASYTRMINGEEINEHENSQFVTKYETKPFTALLINGNGNQQLHVKIIKSNKFYLKTTKNLEGLFSPVNQSGQLLIDLKSANYTNGTLFIFSPNFKYLKLDNVSVQDLSVETDSLTLAVGQAENVNLSGNSVIKKLTIIRDVNGASGPTNPSIRLNNAAITSLTADIKYSSITGYDNKFQEINLKTLGSTVDLSYGEGNSWPAVKNMSLSTKGKSDISLKNIQIENAAGDLSDETKIQMPIINLKQILRK